MKCVACKGRGLCGRPVCPILRRLEEISALPKIGERMEGLSPPEVFVGRQGYPLVRAGPMLPASEMVAQPSIGMDIGEIIALRSSLVRSEARMAVKDASVPGRLLESCQQMAMSSAPVRAEVAFLRPPKGKLQFDGVLSPSGPSAELKGMEITTNPIIPRKVDQIVEDRDVLATDAVKELYSSGIDTGHISRLLSLGLLGRKRKLVPTRWSITASDDMAGRALKDKVIDKPLISDFQLYSGEGLGNHFEILLLPRAFSFELIEIWMAESLWSPEGWIGSDSEGPRDRKKYSHLAGGYYAARLAALERLAQQGRQASVLAVREISKDYWAPLGVWVVRDVARKALSMAPRIFSTLDEAVDEIGRRLKTPYSKWKSYSHLTSGQFQSSLANFF
ncbi:MAG: Nre family DNA repair protein [Methanotrichaceae archaeon]|nr:Nre family DNA repair protein [Methanotrichaceae archaeon]